MNPSENYITKGDLSLSNYESSTASSSSFQNAPSSDSSVNSQQMTYDLVKHPYEEYNFNQVHLSGRMSDAVTDSTSSSFYNVSQSGYHQYGGNSTFNGTNWLAIDKNNDCTCIFSQEQQLSNSRDTSYCENICSVPNTSLSSTVSTYYTDNQSSGNCTNNLLTAQWFNNSTAVTNNTSTDSKRCNSSKRASDESSSIAVPVKMRKNNHHHYNRNVSPAGQSNDDTQSKRFALTVQFLKSCNLYDITMSMANFIKQNSQLQEQIDLLRADIVNMKPSLIKRL